MKKPIDAYRKQELARELPWATDATFLASVLDHMTLFPDYVHSVIVFRFYFGLVGAPLTLREIGTRMDMSTSNAGRIKARILRRLKHPNWHDASRWPKPPVPDPMPPERIAEIAIDLTKWRWRRFGTELYVAELKHVADELGIAEDEMRAFYNAIGERMANRR